MNVLALKHRQSFLVIRYESNECNRLRESDHPRLHEQILSSLVVEYKSGGELKFVLAPSQLLCATGGLSNNKAQQSTICCFTPTQSLVLILTLLVSHETGAHLAHESGNSNYRV